MTSGAKIWRNFRLLVFYVLQIGLYVKLFLEYFRDNSILTQLMVFEFGNLALELIKGFYKYAINFYEALIEAEWAWKASVFSFVDMLLSVVDITFKVYSLAMFMVSYNYPISWARDVLYSISNGMKNIREFAKGRRLIKKVRKFKNVAVEGDEVCGICLLPINEGK
jgi:hypothetical protein